MKTDREEHQGTLSAAQSADVVAHMNNDHAEAVLLYAKTFGGLPQATAANMTGIDETGMDLDVTCENKSARVRIAFDQPLQSAGDTRRVLVDMAATARKLLGESTQS
jgi:putative heme iron utilization protein